MTAPLSSNPGNQYTNEQNAIFTRITRYFDTRFEALSTQVQSDRTEILERLDKIEKGQAAIIETQTSLETRLSNVETELTAIKTEVAITRAELHEVKEENQKLREAFEELNQRHERVENTGKANHQMLQLVLDQFSKINKKLGID
jgi:septal ring factor EnvC (AmiA/AmiB activator)